MDDRYGGTGPYHVRNFIMKWITNMWVYARELWVSRDEPEGMRRLATVYWGVLLAIAACVMAGSVVYGTSRFFSTLNGETSNSGLLSSEGGLILFNRAEFEATVKGFELREENYKRFKEDPPEIADPSR